MGSCKLFSPALGVLLLCGAGAAPVGAQQPVVTAQPPTPEQSQPVTPSNDVVLVAKFPHHITIRRPAGTTGSQNLAETIRLTLVNSSGKAVELKKANACESHVWTVADSTGQTIDDRAICPMIYMPVTQNIAPHGKLRARQRVTLDGSKYQDGGEYTLRYTFWGVAADVRFTTHIVR